MHLYLEDEVLFPGLDGDKFCLQYVLEIFPHYVGNLSAHVHDVKTVQFKFVLGKHFVGQFPALL